MYHSWSEWVAIGLGLSQNDERIVPAEGMQCSVALLWGEQPMVLWPARYNPIFCIWSMMKQYVSETCSLTDINPRDVKCCFYYLFVKTRVSAWGAIFHYVTELLSMTKLSGPAQPIVFVPLQFPCQRLTWLNCSSEIAECYFLPLQYYNPIDTGYECATHILSWLVYGQVMSRNRMTRGIFTGQQGMRHHLLPYQRMEIYFQEILMYHSWRQGLWYPKRLVKQCNFQGIGTVVYNCIERTPLSSCNISNIMVREDHEGVFSLGTSKAFIRMPTAGELLICTQKHRRLKIN